MKVAIVGRGRVGRGLTQALRQAKVDVTLTAGHAPRRAALRRAEVTLICTSDPAIAPTAEGISPWLQTGSVLLHCAGSYGPELLGDVAGPLQLGVLHPLVSFPPPGRAATLQSAIWVIDGAPAAIQAAERLAEAVGANPVVSSIHGSAYHAIAALSANGTAALIGAGVPALEGLGMSRRHAEVALAQLLKSVARNIESVGLPAALTGPVMRGDAETVQAHRAALSEGPEVTQRAYDAILPLILELAKAGGLSRKQAQAIQRLLTP